MEIQSIGVPVFIIWTLVLAGYVYGVYYLVEPDKLFLFNWGKDGGLAFRVVSTIVIGAIYFLQLRTVHVAVRIILGAIVGLVGYILAIYVGPISLDDWGLHAFAIGCFLVIASIIIRPSRIKREK